MAKDNTVKVRLDHSMLVAIQAKASKRETNLSAETRRLIRLGLKNDRSDK
jgi:predicted DNA binding CopG/RHH family protein